VHELVCAYRGERHLNLYRLHMQYGPVVRFTPNSISFKSATALRDIYGARGANVGKSEFYNAFMNPAPNTHNAREKNMHARKRRVLAHGFSDTAIRSMERFVLANVDIFCWRMGMRGGANDGGRQRITDNDTKGWSDVKCMTDWFSYLAFDILGDLCFGKSFSMLEKTDNRYALDLVTAATKRHLLVSCVLRRKLWCEGDHIEENAL